MLASLSLVLTLAGGTLQRRLLPVLEVHISAASGVFLLFLFEIKQEGSIIFLSFRGRCLVGRETNQLG